MHLPIMLESERQAVYRERERKRKKFIMYLVSSAVTGSTVLTGNIVSMYSHVP